MVFPQEPMLWDQSQQQLLSSKTAWLALESESVPKYTSAFGRSHNVQALGLASQEYFLRHLKYIWGWVADMSGLRGVPGWHWQRNTTLEMLREFYADPSTEYPAYVVVQSVRQHIGNRLPNFKQAGFLEPVQIYDWNRQLTPRTIGGLPLARRSKINGGLLFRHKSGSHTTQLEKLIPSTIHRDLHLPVEKRILTVSEAWMCVGDQGDWEDADDLSQGIIPAGKPFRVDQVNEAPIISFVRGNPRFGQLKRLAFEINPHEGELISLRHAMLPMEMSLRMDTTEDCLLRRIVGLGLPNRGTNGN